MWNGFALIVAERNRIYAITSKSRTIASLFCVISASQLALGLYWTVLVATEGGEYLIKLMPAILTYFNTLAEQLIPIPLDVYRICAFMRHRSLEIGFNSISLLYGMSLSSGRRKQP